MVHGQHMYSICVCLQVYCVSSDTCVSTSCMTKKLNKDGQCPPVEPLTSGKKCSSARLCVNDNEGCSGLQKCCENACGGSYCGVGMYSCSIILRCDISSNLILCFTFLKNNFFRLFNLLLLYNL